MPSPGRAGPSRRRSATTAGPTPSALRGRGAATLLLAAFLVVGTGLLTSSPLPAQSCFRCSAAPTLQAYFCPVDVTLATDEPGCDGIINCVQPRMVGPYVEPIDLGNGTFQIRLEIDVRAPFNSHPDAFSNGKLDIAWDEGSTVGTFADLCEHNTSDRTLSHLRLGSASCDTVPVTLGTYSVRAGVCTGSGCQHQELAEGIPVTVTARTLGCLPPRTWSCPEDGTCRDCLGPAGGTSPAGGPPGVTPEGGGPGAILRYAAGGAGSLGTPGAAEWSETLGRGWSHDYALRIVEDPDPSHVWLITEHATFRELSDTDTDGVYETVRPSTEKRTLEATASGWTLTGLDGTVHSFDAAGRWTSTVPPEPDGPAAVGTYDAEGRLAQVELPDGRVEHLAYGPLGKLASITEVGVDGISSATWEYLWGGDDLVRIDRPDGTAWEMAYGDIRFPGAMTRLVLVADVSGLEGSSDDVLERDPDNRRIEAAWEYDDHGNVTATWRGAESFDDEGAVDRWSFAFDDPALPTAATVTDPLGDTSTYTFAADRASVHDRPKVTEIEGGCPVCSLSPRAQLSYADAENPLLPTRIVDGRGIATDFEYDDHGQTTSRTEALTVLERITEWTYHSDYPALPLTRTEPSIVGGSALRTTEWSYDSAGNPQTRTVSGVEGGGSFYLQTETTFNDAGRPVTVDPPGYEEDPADPDLPTDVVTFDYDPVRGGLLASSRTDPLVGTTLFGYDPFNRRTSVTGPDGVETTTAYDPLDRVTEVRRVGSSAGDLVTTHEYDRFGELLRTILPRGNVIEYGYDHAGRLVSVERKPDALEESHGERTVYTLDDAGNRTAELLQRWDAAAESWVTEATTGTRYTSRCQVGSVTRGGHTTSYSHDCNGNLEAVWDATRDPDVDQPSVVYAYDALDRLVSVERLWGGEGGGTEVTTYGYDIQDHLTSVTDAEGNVTTYIYSDRDLLTAEVSPVSGTTTRTYNPHGELISTTDARDFTITRTVDPLDRVTFVGTLDATLDIAYTWDTAPDSCTESFPLGRLGSITRNGRSVDFCYDRFGRTTRDGALTYAYDANGNRTGIVYPGGVEATYGHDFADRQASLEVTGPHGIQEVVSGAVYLPFGPLAEVTLGSTEGGVEVVEERSYDGRYAPERIEVTDPFERVWLYDTDPVGNVLGITERIVCADAPLVLEAQIVTTTELWEACTRIEAGNGFAVGDGGDVTFRASNGIALGDGFSVLSGGRFVAETAPVTGTVEIERSFTYQPEQYFLTGATGPWGSLAWSYDRIGNRLTESRDGGSTVDEYSYATNDASGNTPILDQVTLAVGGTRDYTWGPAGHLETVGTTANPVELSWHLDGRLASAYREASGASTDFTYDGRSFLRQAQQVGGGTAVVTPIYDASGTLHVLEHRSGPTEQPERTIHFHFAGRPHRPVAQLHLDTTDAATWTYLTPDHLGTPILATSQAGTVTWSGGFQPFGTDPQAGTPDGALQNGIHLRLPGQWDDPTWHDATSGAGMYYNVHRWYQPGNGRYTRTDPINLGRLLNLKPLTGLTPFTEYQQANLRLGNPKLEAVYGYAAANPLGLTDPDGRVAPLVCPLIPPALAALGKAVAGAAVVLSAVGAGAVASDWINENRDCDDCDDEPPDRCDELLKNDQKTCGFWAARGNNRNYQACMGAAMRRFAECLQGIFPPRIPLSPSPFD